MGLMRLKGKKGNLWEWTHFISNICSLSNFLIFLENVPDFWNFDFFQATFTDILKQLSMCHSWHFLFQIHMEYYLRLKILNEDSSLFQLAISMPISHQENQLSSSWSMTS